MTDALKKLGEIGLLPTVDVADAAKAVETAKALNEGGIGACVATVETAAAIRAALPECVLGACVATAENVDAAVSAGVDFVVSAGLNPALVEYCVGKNVAIVPGATTASEIELGVSLGLTVFNFFPAPIAGGLDAIKALAEAFPTVRFVPTGAVDWAEIDAYSRCGAILAIGGRFVAPCSAVAAGDWAGIAANAKRAVELLLGLEMGHVGINCQSSDEAGSTADWLGDSRNADFVLRRRRGRNDEVAEFRGEGAYRDRRQLRRSSRVSPATSRRRVPRFQMRAGRNADRRLLDGRDRRFRGPPLPEILIDGGILTSETASLAEIGGFAV